MGRRFKTDDDKVLSLARILHDCGIINAWTTEYYTITDTFGVTITLKDYKLEHDLSNPAVANRPIFLPNDPDFGGFGSLRFDGVDDYLIKDGLSDYRIGDGTGVMYAIINNDTSGKGEYISIGSVDTSFDNLTLRDNNQLRLSLLKDNSLQPQITTLLGGLLWTYGARVIAVASNGSSWEFYVDGQLMDKGGVTGTDNGNWLSHYDVGDLDGIAIGARVSSSLTYGETKQVMAGYGAYTSIAEIKDCQNKLAKYFGLATIQNIVDDYGFLNAWSAEYRTVSGTTTTLHDYLGEHDLSNPAAANQPTLTISAEFGAREVLTFDGVNDYLIKNTADWRGSDSSGVIIGVVENTAASTGYFLSSSDTGAVASSFVIQDNDTLRIHFDETSGTDNDIKITTAQPLWLNGAHVIAIASTGSDYELYVDGVLYDVVTVTTGSNDGTWLDAFADRDNIAIGGIIDDSPTYGVHEMGFMGYMPYVDQATIISCSKELSKYYGLNHLNSIISTYSPTNAWSAEALDVNGTTTTVYDYQEDHNLANPASANQPSFTAASANFGGRPTLTFDGVDDYLIKNTPAWRVGDADGMFLCVARVISGSVVPVISTGDTAAARLGVLRYDSTGINYLHNLGATENFNIIGGEYPNNSKIFIAAAYKSGSTYKVFVNGVEDTKSETGTSAWLDDLLGRDNISIGAQVYSGVNYANIEWAMSAYFSTITEANALLMQKELVAYYKVDTVRTIVERYNFSNAWSAENVAAGGSSTTCFDYLLEHNLANPAAANQPTLTASDADFGNKPSLTFDGVDDYLYKLESGWRGSDESGVLTMVVTDVGGGLEEVFGSSDTAGSSHHASFTITAAELARVEMNSTTSGEAIGGTTLPTTTALVISYASDGTNYYMYINGVLESSTPTGTDGNWMADVLNRDNISIGAVVKNTITYGSIKFAFGGYQAAFVEADVLNLHHELKAYYNF